MAFVGFRPSTTTLPHANESWIVCFVKFSLYLFLFICICICILNIFTLWNTRVLVLSNSRCWVKWGKFCGCFWMSFFLFLFISFYIFVLLAPKDLFHLWEGLHSVGLFCFAPLSMSPFSFSSMLLHSLSCTYLSFLTRILHSDYLFKLLLIGDSGVGKSCLLLRFAVCPPFSIPSPLSLCIFTGRHLHRKLHQYNWCWFCMLSLFFLPFFLIMYSHTT